MKNIYRPICFQPPRSIHNIRITSMEELHKGFLKLGHDSVLLDMGSPNFANDINKVLRKTPNFLITYLQDPLYNIRVGDKSLPQILGVPVITISLDLVYQFFDRFEENLDRHVITAADKGSLEFIEILKNIDLKITCSSFLPHAGISADIPFTEEQYNSRSDRIVYFGSFNEKIQEKPWYKYNSFLKNFMEDVYDLMGDNISFSQAFEYIVKQRELSLNSLLLRNLLFFTYNEVVLYDYNIKRNEIMNYLIKNNYKLDIYGENWPVDLQKYSNVSYKGSVDTKETVKLLNNYKLTLNLYNTWHGTHERVFLSLANGCQCLTHKSDYYLEKFASYEGIYYISRDDFTRDLDMNINKALNEVDFISMKKVNDYVLNNEMWVNRAKAIIELFELCSFSVQFKS